MIELLGDSEESIVGVRVSGKLTAADYETYLIPALDRVFEREKRARFLVLMEEDFDGWTLDAAWDDFSYWLEHRAAFDKVAIVGAPKWVEWCINAWASCSRASSACSSAPGWPRPGDGCARGHRPRPSEQQDDPWMTIIA